MTSLIYLNRWRRRLLDGFASSNTNNNNNGSGRPLQNHRSNSSFIVGPLLCLRERVARSNPSNKDSDATDGFVWRVSLMVGIDASLSQRKRHRLTELRIKSQRQHGRLLDTIRGVAFYVHLIEIVQDNDRERFITYTIGGESHVFSVPASHRAPFIMYYSCNGVEYARNDIGIESMWKSVLDAHDQYGPFHVAIGGGNQLYNDQVFDMSAFQHWLHTDVQVQQDDDDGNNDAVFTSAMENDAIEYYFEHYIYEFTRAHYAHAHATIPLLSCINANDIYSNYHTHAHNIHHSQHIFKGIHDIAMRFYLLFQQHTTMDMCTYDLPCVGVDSQTRLFDMSTLLILNLDLHTLRSQNRILPTQEWNTIFSAVQHHLKMKSSSSSHLLVISSIPIVYPTVNASKKLKNTLSPFDSHNDDSKSMKTKMNVIAQLFGVYDRRLMEIVDLEDNFIDQWNQYNDERNEMISELQRIAQQFSIRITFVSGDVHTAAVGYLKTRNRRFDDDNNNNQKRLCKLNDHRFMMQLISSPIGNHPIPKLSSIVLRGISTQKLRFDALTMGRMIGFRRMTRLFKHKNNVARNVDCDDEDGDVKCFLDNRNWLSLRLLDDDRIRAQLTVERRSQQRVKAVRDAIQNDEILQKRLKRQLKRQEKYLRRLESEQEHDDEAEVQIEQTTIVENDNDSDIELDEIDEQSQMEFRQLNIAQRVAELPESKFKHFVIHIPPLRIVGNSSIDDDRPSD